MREWKSQSHVKWYCKYHIVFSPKYRKKAMFGSLRKGVGKILRELCNQSGVELVEGHAMSDHVHLCLSIPPKYSVANTVGFLKGKSAIRIHREYLGNPYACRRRRFERFLPASESRPTRARRTRRRPPLRGASRLSVSEARDRPAPRRRERLSLSWHPRRFVELVYRSEEQGIAALDRNARFAPRATFFDR